MTGDEITRLADGLPAHTILVLDGAYAEYVDGFDGGAAMVEARENVVMTRTFSKVYGLGGLRIGWGYGPQAIIDVLNRVRGPFNLSDAQLDTVEAALRDREYLKKCLSENARLRVWLSRHWPRWACQRRILHKLYPRVQSPDEADACDAYLKQNGLIVRRVAGYKLPDRLRITVGDEASCRRIVHAIRGFKEAME